MSHRKARYEFAVRQNATPLAKICMQNEIARYKCGERRAVRKSPRSVGNELWRSLERRA